MKRNAQVARASSLIIGLRYAAVVLATGATLILGLAACTPGAPPSGAAAQPGRGATDASIPPFPSGFDYPANPDSINAAIARRDTARLRQHGWWLWAGLNTTTRDGVPFWWSWPTATRTFGLGAGPSITLRAASGENTPINLPAPYYAVPQVVGNTQCRDGTSKALPDGDAFQSNGDIMIADVVFNGDAFNWIRNTGLYRVDTLNAQWQRGTTNIEPFPSGSIELKHMYWPVKASGYTALPVWDPPAPAPTTYMGYEMWNRAVAIDPSGNPVSPS